MNNLKTAALGLAVRQSLLARADDGIERGADRAAMQGAVAAGGELGPA